MLLARWITHVSIEVVEHLPSAIVSDSTTTIISIALVVYVVATLLHRIPDLVDAGSMLSVTRWPTTLRHTSTRGLTAAPKLVGADLCSVSTGAHAVPQHPSSLSRSLRYNGQIAKRLSDEIEWRTHNFLHKW